MNAAVRPTHVRYVILGLTTGVAAMLYLDRWCVGSVAQDIRDQLRLSAAETDWMQSVFFLSYALGQIPCGWLADRYGPRAMLTFYLFSWSALTALMGLASSLTVLVLFRLGCGLFEAGAYPACAGLVRRWMPYRERGLGSAFVGIGGRVGAAIGFPLTAYLMVAFATRSRPPEFEPRDLIEPRAIARELGDPQAPQAGSLTRALAAHVEPQLTAAQRQVLQSVAAAATDPADPAVVAALAGLLNDLLHRPELLRGLDLEPYRDRIPPAALAPAASPGAAGGADVTRRNRRVVEVALANRVCKLDGWGWRPTLAVYGLAGVGLAVIFGLFFRDQPRRHPLVNAAEADHIAQGPAGPAGSDAVVPPAALWRGILTSRSLWLCSLVQVGTNFGWAFLGTKLPEYLERVHQVPKIERGWLVFLPFVLSVPMTMVGGAWTDWTTRHWGPWLGRAFPMGSTRFVAAAAFLACVVFNAPWPITVAMCVMSVASDMGLPALWAYNLDVGGRNVGLILGWGNMWGNFGAFASPVLLGLIQEYYGWDGIFLACTAVFLVIGVAAFGVDATRPIVAPPPDRAG